MANLSRLCEATEGTIFFYFKTKEKLLLSLKQPETPSSRPSGMDECLKNYCHF
jgi:hypothetical protein